MSIPSVVSLVTLFTSLNLAIPQVLANNEHNHHDLHRRHHQLAERGRYHEVRSDGSSSPPAVPLLKSRTPSHVKRDEVQYNLLGCFSELSDGALLLETVAPWNATSLKTCVESCYTFSSTPFVYAGIFNGIECRCGNELPAGATQVEQANCKTPCAAGTDLWCGGPSAYQVYKLPFTPTPPATQDPTQPVEEPTPSSSPILSDSLDGTIAESPAPSSDPASSESPDGTIVDNPIPSPTADVPSNTEPTIPSSLTISNGLTFSAAGCLNDLFEPTSRLLRGPFFKSDAMTPTVCADSCFKSGYPYAGVEYGNECYCGSAVFVKDLPIDGCRQACSGDASVACGAPGQLGLYSIDDWSWIVAPRPLPTSSDGKWQSVGCYIDDLTRNYTPINFFDGEISVDLCTSACDSSGFTRAALEYGNGCFCGDDIETALQADPHDCDTLCPVGGGTCGGGWRWDVYEKIA
ncbi:WSC-domain-containing protein [Serendipita vermifera]|nr:WSC-domain-containing protein [Serendipita vermifera]